MMYTVVYLKHSLFASAQEITEIMTQSELVQLLQSGMISLLSAKAVAMS